MNELKECNVGIDKTIMFFMCSKLSMKMINVNYEKKVIHPLNNLQEKTNLGIILVSIVHQVRLHVPIWLEG